MTSDLTDIQLHSIAGLSKGQDWRVQLAHTEVCHLLIWITRGQGRIMLDGLRRGAGPHNAIFIPAGSLFSLELGRQTLGQVVRLPTGSPLRLPEMPRQLRIREVLVLSELTGIIEAAQREVQGGLPLAADALEAHAALMSVWLRRQIMDETHLPARRNAGQRLSQRFCALVAQHYTSGDPMAAYAAHLGVTPTHLTRAVKAATGKTASDLLTERVLHEARRLLIETRQPARQIAAHLGFGSAAYFTRFIQHQTGRNPTKLRSAA